MKLVEAQEKFIQAWGTLGSSWGINRTMAQVHALLLISPDSMSAEDIMDELNISRGNANMNVRALIDWGLVSKEFKSGERKEFFVAEKDIWKVATQVMKERRKRELEPVLKVLSEVSQVEGDKKDKKIKAFTDSINGIQSVVSKADKTIETLIKADENWFVSSFMKLLK
jgi:DNA-binding transcriptional regulator GbsR (MarR family)